MRGEEEEREKKQSITVAVTYPTYPNRKETKRQESSFGKDSRGGIWVFDKPSCPHTHSFLKQEILFKCYS